MQQYQCHLVSERGVNSNTFRSIKFVKILYTFKLLCAKIVVSNLLCKSPYIHVLHSVSAFNIPYLLFVCVHFHVFQLNLIPQEILKPTASMFRILGVTMCLILTQTDHHTVVSTAPGIPPVTQATYDVPITLMQGN